MTPPLGVTPFEFCDEIWQQKTKIVGLPDGEGIHLRFYTIPARYGRTDRRTETRVKKREKNSH